MEGEFQDGREGGGSSGVSGNLFPTVPGTSVVASDPPLHRDYRKLFDRIFTRRALEPAVPTMERIADRRIR